MLGKESGEGGACVSSLIMTECGSVAVRARHLPLDRPRPESDSGADVSAARCSVVRVVPILLCILDDGV